MTVRPWNGRRKDVAQAAAVPYRRVDGRCEICLVTATSGRWTFPKGTVKRSSKLVRTARDEAWEEAGIRGRMADQPFAVYDLPKSTGRRVAAFLMEVEEVADEWPESSWRRRTWVEPLQAASLLAHPELNDVLKAACWEIEQRAQARRA